ncbi:MAG TPA: hypothetical protein VHX92_03940 [Rhizomicrobium sp.]|jgi:hypothetical protein|nr:hypothetical protein [Rhizomicrobium sp.]
MTVYPSGLSGPSHPALFRLYCKTQTYAEQIGGQWTAVKAAPPRTLIGDVLAKTCSPAEIENCSRLSGPGQPAAEFAQLACLKRQAQERSQQRSFRFAAEEKEREYQNNPLVVSLRQHYDPAVKYPDYCFSSPRSVSSGLSSEQLQTCISAEEAVATKIAQANAQAAVAQQKDDAARLAALPSAANFMALVPCPQGQACNDAIYRKVWSPWVEADNGLAFTVDMESVVENDNGTAAVYEGVRHVTPIYAGLKRLLFDCAGHMTEVAGETSASIDLPPRSVGTQIAKIVCTALHR